MSLFNSASLAADRYREKDVYKNPMLVSRENIKRKKLKENIKHKNRGIVRFVNIQKVCNLK